MGLFGYSFGIVDEESRTTAFILVFLFMLVFSIIMADHLVGHHLNSKMPFNIPESGVTMFLGMVLGGFITLFASDESLSENALVTFSPTIFFLAFLPPIIFNEGYHLKQQFFFGFIKEILIFAVVGTGISAIIMSLFIYNVPGQPAGSMMTFPEAAAFGGLISATDPVAVLAILGQLRVEPALFYLVFGESVLNDAVSLTIYNIASKFIGEEHGFHAAMIGVFDFFVILIGSCAVGYIIPCITAYVLKKAHLGGHVVLEMSVYLLMSYVPYLFAEIVGMSGIVSILMAGITTRSYTHRNLSTRKTQEYADFFYRLCSFLADNAVFLYLGMTVFGLHDIKHKFDIGFIAWTFFGCVVSRGCVVVSLSFVINMLTGRTNLNAIGWKNQFVLWFAGLRGAVAFAAASTFPTVNGNAEVVLTTTMGIIIVYTFIAAPLTMPVIKKLGMPMNVEYDSTPPPRMPRLVRWLYVFDERFIDQVLILKCAQRGGACEYYHLENGCPLSMFTGDHHGGGHGGGHDEAVEDSNGHGNSTGAESSQAILQGPHERRPSVMRRPSSMEINTAMGVTSMGDGMMSPAMRAAKRETELKDVYNFGGAITPPRAVDGLQAVIEDHDDPNHV